jgi:hypothetical protein
MSWLRSSGYGRRTPSCVEANEVLKAASIFFVRELDPRRCPRSF